MEILVFGQDPLENTTYRFLAAALRGEESFPGIPSSHPYMAELMSTASSHYGAVWKSKSGIGN